ncbi:diguanylate cyclase, partial [Pseudoalteromonas sp. S1650]
VVRPVDVQAERTENRCLGEQLKTSQGVIGLIVCQAYNKKHEFKQDDSELIRFLTHQIGNFIQTHLANQELKLNHQKVENRVAEKSKEVSHEMLLCYRQLEEI